MSKNRVPFTEAEQAYLISKGFTHYLVGVATDGYSKITKRAVDQFIRVLYIEDYEGNGFWDDDHADHFSALDFL